ncbi:MAG: hypothetical protein GX835_01590, partial [Desulfobulbaceae bacterium]|nr:hypothetical protein [Desulfobulbaceae bacterium]
IINILTPDRVLMLTEGLNIFRCPVPTDLVGKTLLESGIRENTGCSVIALFREGRLRINPEPGESFGADDEMVMIGTAESEKNCAALDPEKGRKGGTADPAPGVCQRTGRRAAGGQAGKTRNFSTKPEGR